MTRATQDPKSGRPPAPRAVIRFTDNSLLADLFGEHDRNLARLEQQLGVTIKARGDKVAITGPAEARALTEAVMRHLYGRLEGGESIDFGDLDGTISMFETAGGEPERAVALFQENVVTTAKRVIRPRSAAQARYIAMIRDHELGFGLGPAGTGKTYLAVACAVSMLLDGRVDRLILSRPAVEAGERLGFLPGDMRDKVDPYLRPLYDALYDMLPGDQVIKRLASGEIEVAPLAFMRGRTLANAFVILDEAQNTTPVQMKMFLTRLGENSRMVVTGDPSQVDLPRGMRSGLADAVDALAGGKGGGAGIKGMGIVRFTEVDVVRHSLVTRVLHAYNDRDRRVKARRQGGTTDDRRAG